MDPERKRALDTLGKFLMAHVRDEAISYWEDIVSGHMKGETASKVRAQLGTLPKDATAIVSDLVPLVVDSVLHRLLTALEERETVDLGVKVGSRMVPGVAKLSDGLAGELYSDAGWIKRFSKSRQ